MTRSKTLGLNLALIGLLSACGSTPFLEQSTGINLLQTNQAVYTLVNLHPTPATTVCTRLTISKQDLILDAQKYKYRITMARC